MAPVVRILCLIIACCFVAPALAEKTVYKHVDEHGNVTFSDVGAPGAEEIVVKDPQTIEPPGVPHRPPAARQGKSEQRKYEITISAPAHDQVFADNTGVVAVSVHVEGRLSLGHRLQVGMDGSTVSDQPSFTLSDVERGSHTLTARVVGENDKVLGASAPVTFHVKRPIVKPAAKKKPAK